MCALQPDRPAITSPQHNRNSWLPNYHTGSFIRRCYLPRMPAHDEKHEFSTRLHEALARAGIKTPTATTVARKFNVLYAGEPVTAQAVRKWLEGTAIPAQDKIRVLARWLKVSAHWLRLGEKNARKKDTGEESPSSYSRRDLGE